ncbi:MAG: lamin tail domain-containing protein [Candidatus Marinimicrobia bacterium]|nr:lamin tail domain-containing protein [Candidatus Neomarinimicrobiota bacterium]MCF7904711.1 lamin tail domain-containing protein [Candidatus Neomarinimicrobiota bacterium]
MKKAILVVLAISLYASEIRISEVMSNPQGSEYENEYIELYNPGADMIFINGWVLSDGSGLDTIISIAGPEGIQPMGYALILDPSYDLAGGLYSGLIPENVSIYSISTDATFGSGGLSNSGELVLVRNSDSSVLTTMSWSQASDNGYSWERVDLKSPDSVALWKQSLVENGTPGFKNSVVLPSQDLGVSIVQVEYDSLNSQLRTGVSIKNEGSDPVESATLVIRLQQHDEDLYQVKRDLHQIQAGDSVQWNESIGLSICGWLHLNAMVQSVEDDHPENDEDSLSLYVPCEQPPIILNEIMPKPFTGEAEWVEIFNRSDRLVNLKGWQFSDANPTQHRLSDSSIYMLPGEYLLLSDAAQITGKAWDAEVLQLQSFPTLNNDTDICILIEPNGNHVDSIFYDEITGLVEGRSLERLRLQAVGTVADNWRICVDESGSTPGSQNSLYLEHLKAAYSIELVPNPFITGDHEKGEMSIHLELPVEQAVVSVSIYDLAGREIAIPVPLKVVAHKSQLSWDGKASYGGITDTGLYICRVVIDDMNGQVSEFFKKVYVISD